MSWWRATLSAGLLVVGMQAWTAQPAAATALSSTTASAPAASPPGAWSASSSAHSALIGRSPFGLSLEYPLMERALGSGPCPGPALVAALQELGSPSLRIGGDSQDLAGPTTAYHRYFIPPSFWTTLGCLARETGVQVTVGLNLAKAPVADDLSTIAAAEQAIPAAQLSFSLGNEPDLYGISHIFPDEPGVTIPAFRPSPWTPAEYVNEWEHRRALLGQIQIEGPDLAGIGWRAQVGRMLAMDPPDVMDVHAYPTSACSAPLTTAARLLAKHASVGLVEKYGWLLRIARAAHRPAIISESNSASCGGKPGVSNTPVAGVWATRYVVAALLAGFAQVRFHSAGGSYDPLVFNADGTITMRPLAHALLFLHRWIPVGSSIQSDSNDPRVLAATITDGSETSVIVSSFSAKPLSFSIAVPGAAADLPTAVLTTHSAIEEPGSVAVTAHRAQLMLAPDTVLAVRTG
jgi:hypothetical protein